MSLPRLSLLVLGLTALFATSCQKSEAASPPKASAAPAAASPRPSDGRAQLLFFINPNGRPCQIQDGILKELGPELTQKVGVVYVATTRPEDFTTFQRYGIRALPSLVLVDASGREVRRGPPGIQGPDQVRQLVGL